MNKLLRMSQLLKRLLKRHHRCTENELIFHGNLDQSFQKMVKNHCGKNRWIFYRQSLTALINLGKPMLHSSTMLDWLDHHIRLLVLIKSYIFLFTLIQPSIE
jgi:hypothetical protein